MSLYELGLILSFQTLLAVFAVQCFAACGLQRVTAVAVSSRLPAASLGKLQR